jgi:hypothetical protein
MLRLSLRTGAVLAVIFLSAEGLGDAAFLWGARAETVGEAGEETVDCVLPGEIRPLGSTTYITRGRTIKTTKKDCEARGGRPVAPGDPAAESGPAQQDAPASPERDKTTD